MSKTKKGKKKITSSKKLLKSTKKETADTSAPVGKPVRNTVLYFNREHPKYDSGLGL